MLHRTSNTGRLKTIDIPRSHQAGQYWVFGIALRHCQRGSNLTIVMAHLEVSTSKRRPVDVRRWTEQNFCALALTFFSQPSSNQLHKIGIEASSQA